MKEEIKVKLLKVVRNYTSSMFLLCLVISVVLWYSIKLGNVYTTTIPVKVNLDGEKFRVECQIEGIGYDLGSLKYFGQRLQIPLSDLEKITTDSSYIIDPISLQSAISVRNKGLKFVSIGKIPEIIKK